MDFLNTNSFYQELESFYIQNKYSIYLVGAFFTSFILTLTAIPKIIRVSYKKHLMDIPGERSSHKQKIPNLGGIAIFYSLSISATIFAYGLFGQYIFLFACLVILMFVGLMDDILVVAPDKKLYAQLVVSLMITVGSDVRIGNFFGLMGIEKLPYLLSIIFTVMVFIILINSYNLIDGIDGLAASIAILSSLAFIYSFHTLGDYDMVILSIALIASLLAFLMFNLSTRWKIIMGDTGSMIVGFLITFMAIKFLNLLMLETRSGSLYFHLPSAPAIAVSILIIPIIDTITVIIIRLTNGRKPWSADKNHIHHRYVDLGLSHKQVTGIIFTLNAIILVITYSLRALNVNLLLALVLFMGLIVSLLPFGIKKWKS